MLSFSFVCVPDRRIHGEVSLSMGTGGYRSAYGAAVMPIGKYSSLAVAVALDLRGKGDGAPPPGCAPGVRIGDRYMEPLWLMQMRAASAARETGACEGRLGAPDSDEPPPSR